MSVQPSVDLSGIIEGIQHLLRTAQACMFIESALARARRKAGEFSIGQLHGREHVSGAVDQQYLFAVDEKLI